MFLLIRFTTTDILIDVKLLLLNKFPGKASSKINFIAKRKKYYLSAFSLEFGQG